jgi:DMSO/TMAO reductase YedYZ molybdopterin-dependent catalytic subunit
MSKAIDQNASGVLDASSIKDKSVKKLNPVDVNQSRRSFLKTTSLASVAAMVGMAVPFQDNVGIDFIPAAMADTNVMPTKDGLTLLNDRPINAETPAELLDDNITPTNRLFVRNNGTVPANTSAKDWTLTIDGFVDNPLTLSIDDLRSQFEVVTMALQLECGGNGRSAFVPPASGNQWTTGAIGCSEWTGVRLKDVLNKAGVKSNVIYTAHYGTDGHLSGDPKKIPISRGIPIAKAMTDNVLIAFQQNGADIDILNGAPLRLVVPGWPGSCSHKWLTRIELRDVVHDGPKMTGRSYRVPAYPVAPGTDVPIEDFVIMGRMPVKSLVTFPANGKAVSGLKTDVRGHAWAGDRSIDMVEVSIDFGASWEKVELDAPVNDGAWQNWRGQVNFPMAGYYEVWARAMDSEGEFQPHAISWNPRGYNNNTMHRVGLSVS